MRRFETKEHSPSRFWEIAVEGSSLEIRYGEVGTEGVTRTRSVSSAEQAMAEAETRIRHKKIEGWVEVDPLASQPAASRDENADWAVRGDRLQIAGDPWGQRIALSMARDSATERDEQQRFDRALAELDAEHAEQLYGKELLALEAKGLVVLDWKRGYIVRVEITSKKRSAKQLGMAEVVHALVRSRAAEFLRDLIVSMDHVESEGLLGVVSTLAAGPPLPALELLALGSLGATPNAMAQAKLGDLSALWPITPKLRTLLLRGHDMGFARFEHPSLQHLVLETSRLPPASVRNLASANLPELRQMEARTLAIDDLVPLFTDSALPKLEHLDLQLCAMLDERAIVLALARSNLLAQLRHLDLSSGTMHEPGARALIKHAERFQRLEFLDLRHNAIPEALHEPLRAAIPAVQVEWQKPGPRGIR